MTPEDKNRVADALAYIDEREMKLADIIHAAVTEADDPSDEFCERIERLTMQYEESREEIVALSRGYVSDKQKKKLFALIDKVYSW